MQKNLKKLIRADPKFLQSWATIGPKLPTQKRDFWKIFTEENCIDLLSCHAVKFDKIFRAYHEIHVCIGSRHKWAKIMYLDPKKNLREISFR